MKCFWYKFNKSNRTWGGCELMGGQLKSLKLKLSVYFSSSSSSSLSLSSGVCVVKQLTQNMWKFNSIWFSIETFISYTYHATLHLICEWSNVWGFNLGIERWEKESLCKFYESFLENPFLCHAPFILMNFHVWQPHVNFLTLSVCLPFHFYFKFIKSK